MKILDKLYDPGPDIYYSVKFRNVLEDHLSWLKKHPDNITITVEPMMAYKYAGDIVGIFQENNVPAHLHWIAMRMNGLINPTDYTEDMTVLIVPSSATVDKLRNTFNSQSKLKK